MPTLDTVTLGAASVVTVTVGAGARASVATVVPGSSISHSACAVNDERPSSRAVARIAFMISPKRASESKTVSCRAQVGVRKITADRIYFSPHRAPR